MVAPALLCSSLAGSLPVVTVVAFFAATIFKNTKVAEAPHPPLQWPTLEEAAPFLLFLFLASIDIFMRVTHDRQAALLTQESQEALEDARRCRAEAKPLETPDTFAQAAKLQRKALMREKHARELADLKAKHGSNIVYRLLRFAHTGAALSFVAWWWSRPAITGVQQQLLWPMDDALSLLPGRGFFSRGASGGGGGYGGAAAGVISAPAWAWICMAASSRVAGLVQALIPSPRLY